MGRATAALFFLATLAIAAPRPATAGGGAPVAIAAEVAAEDGRTRLTVTLSADVPVTAFVLEAPDRVVVDLPAVNFQLPPATARRRNGLIAGMRSGLLAPGRSRIVLDLSGPALVTRVEMAPGPSDAVRRLVVDLARTDRESFRRAARADRGEPETTGSVSAAPEKPDPRPVLVIDAGHGGIDPGATAANGAFEKDVVLVFAQALRARLLRENRFRIVMTRDDDTFVPLDERVRRAREAGAELFVSIHADSIGSPSVRGATVYTGAERATDAESAKLADRENAADALAGLPAQAPALAVSDILHDLTARETRGFSHRFAHLLLSDMGRATRWTVQPHREAGFRVLRAHDVPAVLVELGYLSNARDADLLASEPWRERVSAAMAGAIVRFFGARAPARAAMSP